MHKFIGVLLGVLLIGAAIALWANSDSVAMRPATATPGDSAAASMVPAELMRRHGKDLPASDQPQPY
jgi:hypothetical protein